MRAITSTTGAATATFTLVLCIAAAFMSVVTDVQARPQEQSSAFAALPGARLVGQGRLTWFGLRIYDARLWTTAVRVPPDRPMDAPFALELEYARSLKGADIAARSAEEIERLNYGDPASRADWARKMRALFPDVARGDRITGVNVPGQGARFFLNGAPIGSIDDPGFADAFFAIWFDPKTADPSLRDELLGGRG